MRQILRATGVVLLSMVAAGLFVTMMYMLVAGRWWPGLWSFLACFSYGGNAYVLFGYWIRHSPRHKGKDHVHLHPLAAVPAGPGELPVLRARPVRGRADHCPSRSGTANPFRAPGPDVPRAARHPGEVNLVEPLVHNLDGSVEPGPDESWAELAEHSLTHDDLPAAS